MSSGAEASYRLSESFDQALIYLPGVIDYLEELPFREGDWGHEMTCAAKGIYFFLTACRRELQESQLMDPCVATVAVVLRNWNSRLVVEEPAEDWQTAVLIPPVAVFLNSLVESSVPFDKASIFDDLFDRWQRETAEAAVSANLLVMFLHVKRSSSDLLLFRHPLILRSAFDTHLCERHFQVASDLLHDKCPAFLIEEIEQWLL